MSKNVVRRRELFTLIVFHTGCKVETWNKDIKEIVLYSVMCPEYFWKISARFLKDFLKSNPFKIYAEKSFYTLLVIFAHFNLESALFF